MNGYLADIEKLTKENTDFRRVLYTAPGGQLVLMCLKTGEEIGEEVCTLDAAVICYGRLSASTGALAAIRWPVLGAFGAAYETSDVAPVGEGGLLGMALPSRFSGYSYRE